MDFLTTAKEVAGKFGEVYGDYQRGRKARLGIYSKQGMKRLGHYDAQGRRLAIYHG